MAAPLWASPATTAPKWKNKEFPRRRASPVRRPFFFGKFPLKNRKKGIDKWRLMRIISNVRQDTAGLCNGSTADSDSVCEGSNPSPAAKETRVNRLGSFFVLCCIVGDSTLTYILIKRVSARSRRRRSSRVRILLPLPKRLASLMQVSFFVTAISLRWIRKTLTYCLINARKRAKPPQAVFEGSNPSPASKTTLPFGRCFGSGSFIKSERGRPSPLALSPCKVGASASHRE